MRLMTKSTVRLAREALLVGQHALPRYGSRFSRHDFTQPQLFALLALKQFLQTDYRGLVTLLAEWSECGVSCVEPCSCGECRTIQRCATRSAGSSLAPGKGALRAGASGHRPSRVSCRLDRSEAPVAAIDATGLEARHVSLYYRIRREQAKRPSRRRRAWPKLTAVVHTHSHFIVGAMTGTGPTQDSPEFTPAMRQAVAILPLDTVLADAGYDR